MRGRRLYRVRAVIGVLLALFRVPIWLVTNPQRKFARWLEQGFFNRILAGCGLSVRIIGKPASSALIVANHISWADIAAFAALLDAKFVAKAEIGRWPVIGALARRFGVIFVTRNDRFGIGGQVSKLQDGLEAGRSVILFPEGTTSDGATVRPFRSSLFAAASAASFVQPVLIRYCEIDGRPLSSARQREVAWIDDDGLIEGMMRVARERTLIEIEFMEPLDSETLAQRKTLADAAHTAIAEAMRQRRTVQDSARRSPQQA